MRNAGHGQSARHHRRIVPVEFRVEQPENFHVEADAVVVRDANHPGEAEAGDESIAGQSSP